MFGSRLSGPISNNAFAYDERKISDPDPKLRIPSIKTIATIDAVQQGTTPCFAELDEKKKVTIYTGLEHIYHLTPSPKRKELESECYIFDNHNYALAFRAEYILSPLPMGEGSGVRVLHIDQHSDLHTLTDRETIQQQSSRTDPLFWKQLSTQVCNVGNFIHPALDAGLISECIWIKNLYDLRHYPLETTISLRGQGEMSEGQRSSYILDIDLDFRAPEMGTDLQTSIPLVQALMKQASLITIATSPYFLDQNRALDLLHLLFDNLYA